MATIFSDIKDLEQRVRTLKAYIDGEMPRLVRAAFSYRTMNFPPRGLQTRLEASFGNMVVKFHETDTSAVDGGKALANAYELLALNIRKAEWSFQNSADPEGPDAPWGERTVTNDYPNRYSIKSFEAYVTPTGFGVVGYDMYGDRGMHFDRYNNPDETGLYRDWQAKRPPVPVGTPGAKTVDEMMEMANAMALEIIAEYELPEDRLTPATEVVAESPKQMTPRSEAAPASAVAAPRL
ncbi:hypothetical protein OIU34_22955 [Pararhizobium sp. BT-229]|uniref:hypothetical protein n=1 Tax=Pararhizobium sp. BT-229 TaxID=2986923 RepID=UPI0021F7E3F8|nr:hypothetical protein [Pararhizobium sp. BT-229]MCV9964755.1 hypothetical protein [Pararhizobium sp. BT-229]